MITLLFSPIVFSAETAETPRPKIGLVLAGGGAKGLAHIGVIKTLEAHHIKIDYIAGTSMGALVGGLYASGMPINQIEKFARNVDWKATFIDDPKRYYLPFRQKRAQSDYPVKAELGMRDWQLKLPPGIILGQKQDILLEGLLLNSSDIHDFSKLPIPFTAVATDITTGHAYELTKGNLARAMHASMAVPGVFAPVEIDGHLLVDGGITNNTPIDVARKMGADIVIVSDIHTNNSKQAEIRNFLDVFNQLVNSLTLDNTEKQLATLTKKDILIRPKIQAYGSSDFICTDEIIDTGTVATLKALKETSLESYSRVNFSKPKRQASTYIIQRIIINNQTKLSTDIIKAGIHQPIGQPIDLVQLEKDISFLYATGYFQNLNYHLNSSPNDHHTEDKNLVITAIEPSWGPNFFRAKFNLASNLSDQSLFNLGVRHTYKPANANGAEWRNEFQIGETTLLSSEFYQPIDNVQTYYVKPFIKIENNSYTFSPDSLGVTSIDVNQTEGNMGLQFGINITTNDRISTTLSKRKGILRLGSNAHSSVDKNYSLTNSNIAYQRDTLDQISFPRTGTLLNLGLSSLTKNLGHLKNSIYPELKFSFYRSYQRHTLNIYGEYIGADRDNKISQYNIHTLGGFQRLSGLRENELLGSEVVLGRLKYRYRIYGDSSNIFNFPFYVGATLETGNVFGQINSSGRGRINFNQLKTAGSIFIGLNTAIGPVYLAYGRQSEANQTLYFYFGRSFD